ncbi:MAG: hypothetical protein AB1592_01910 [Pseudomonadota bacterium]
MGHEGEKWFSLTLAGFRALQVGDVGCAEARWVEAERLAADVFAGTPLQAVALTNRAALSGRDLAGADLHAPISAWEAIRDRALTEEMTLPARSSAFHLRLASRHAAPFARFLRHRALSLAERGRWLAQANGLSRSGPPDALRHHLGCDDAALAPMPRLLDAAVRAMRDGALDSAGASALLAAQVEDIAAAGPPCDPPETLRAQLEACLAFCAFAPLIDLNAPAKEPDA